MKHLEIEWRYLDKDGNACDRCSDSGETEHAAYADLVKEKPAPKGWEMVLKETLLTDQEIPESNAISYNGIAFEKLLPDTRKSESCCASRGEIPGAPAMCRTLERKGQLFGAIPAAMIVETAHRFIETQTK